MLTKSFIHLLPYFLGPSDHVQAVFLLVVGRTQELLQVQSVILSVALLKRSGEAYEARRVGEQILV